MSSDASPGNVLANLVAAALIYLLAQAASYIKGGPLVTSVVVLAVIAAAQAALLCGWKIDLEKSRG